MLSEGQSALNRHDWPARTKNEVVLTQGRAYADATTSPTFGNGGTDPLGSNE